MQKLALHKIIQFQQNTKFPYLWDVMLHPNTELKTSRRTQITLSVYPLSRKLTADSFQIFPYEEYIDDLTGELPTAYAQVQRNGDKLFGLILLLAIFSLFAIFAPNELISLQSIVTGLGAYVLGKEFWHDLSRLFWHKGVGNISWQPKFSMFQRLKFPGLESYWQTARQLRYGQVSNLAHQMSVIEHSNSKAVILEFNNLASGKQRLISLHLQPELALHFIDVGFLYTLSISQYRQLWFLRWGWSQTQGYVFKQGQLEEVSYKQQPNKYVKLGDITVNF
jgi:hypothetical protein